MIDIKKSANKQDRHTGKLWLLKCSIAIVALFVGFVFCEIAVRVLSIGPDLPKQYSNMQEDLHIPWRPKPNSTVEGTSQSREFTFKYEHNSLGFRDVEHPLTKPDGIYRILGVGDSFTYGAGTDFENTYLYILEGALNRNSQNKQKVEIIKAGISRFWPEPERELVQYYGLSFNPDLILVGFTLNDVIDTRFGLRLEVQQGYLINHHSSKLGPLGVWLSRNSRFFRLISSVIINYNMPEDLEKGDWSFNKALEDNGMHEPDWQKIEKEYLRIKELADSIGAKFAIANLYTERRPRKHDDYPARRLSKWSAENDIIFIDTRPAMLEAMKTDRLFWPKDGHCNSKGYAVYGKVLAEKLGPVVSAEQR